MSSLLNLFKASDQHLFQIVESIKSIVGVMFISNKRISKKMNQLSRLQDNDICYVLGNGPSLANELEINASTFQENDTLVVNYFANTDYFKIIKPKYYLLLDRSLFNDLGVLKERNDVLIKSLNGADWDVKLFIPYAQRKSDILKRIKNEHVEILYYNSTTTMGYEFLRTFIYKNNLGIPSSRNVSIPSILTMVNLNYKYIYLFGMDHSWLETLKVDEDNRLYEDDRHFYSKEKRNKRFKNVDMKTLMKGFGIVFESHSVIQNYAHRKGVKIYNCNPDSFIDSYTKISNREL